MHSFPFINFYGRSVDGGSICQPTALVMDPVENPRFLSDQLITCIGNKRALLGFLAPVIESVKERLGKSKLNIGDYFSGSGIVSRYFKAHATRLVSNDLEPYGEVVSRCFLTNARELDWDEAEQYLRELESRVVNDQEGGFISSMYAPQDDRFIQDGERVFYTRSNALYLDAACRAVHSLPEKMKYLFLGPLLSSASVHANTSGVFKGFYKDEKGIGCFGGRKGDALKRICGEIRLELPVLSEFSCSSEVYRMDANELACRVDDLDLIYLDPPYNQHPYGSNYFMLNLIADYGHPGEVSRVSGIPVSWNRSNYNAKKKARESLFSLIQSCRASHVLVSYNSEGFIAREDFEEVLSKLGKVSVQEISYNTFRGSRNLKGRDIYVKEYLYLLEK